MHWWKLMLDDHEEHNATLEWSNQLLKIVFSLYQRMMAGSPGEILHPIEESPVGRESRDFFRVRSLNLNQTSLRK